MSNRFNSYMEESFYNYGLFSSKHPISLICLSAVIILSCCYPLLNLPIPGSEPQQFFSLLSDVADSGQPETAHQGFPPWYTSANRTAFIQQFFVKFHIASWTTKAIGKTKMIKASLYSVFPILEEIKNFSIANGISIHNDCFHVATSVFKPKQRLKKMFPENSCLLVSPASYWTDDKRFYASDQNIQRTIDQFESKTIKAPPSIKELLFGLSLKHSQLKFKKSSVSFAITLVLKQYNSKLIRNLEKKLHSLYSAPTLEPYHRICSTELEHRSSDICSNLSQVVTHIRFKPQMRVNDLFPLLSTYFVLGCYIYFSVRKINFVKSKIGMAFSAVVSVIASLMMAVGLCSLIGLTPTLNGGEMFPYLVCFVGLENILVITKSVVKTHSHLNVDQRIAIGLSLEGGSIIKNLLLELVLISLGYFTYIPKIKEFCAFAFVGILSDFFISMFFFVTVLSLDIRRLDVEDPFPDSTNNESETVYPVASSTVKRRTLRIDSKSSESHAMSIENGGEAGTILKIPKRLRVIFLLADIRMIQRGLMVFFVIWFSVLLYSNPSGVFHDHQASIADYASSHLKMDAIASLKEIDNIFHSNDNTKINWGFKDVLSSHYLSFRHWPTLFAYYNITLADRFISVLPSILIPISSNEANLHHVFNDEIFKEVKTDNSKTSTAAPEIYNIHIPDAYQMTGFDYYITLIMGAVSGIIIVFLLNIMYQCICSRKYAMPPPTPSDPGECTRIRLKGHLLKVDCVHVEGVTVTSADISGQLRTWDAHSGDCTCVISREQRYLPVNSKPANRFQYRDHDSSLLATIAETDSKPCVWSVVSSGQFIVVGCSNGEIEVWDSVSCALQCTYDDCDGGVVGLACEERRIVAARITGRLDFFVIEDYLERQRSHKRSPSDILLKNHSGCIVNLQLLHTVKSAHQQPICAFEMCMRRVLTGSRDHTLKLYNFQDAKCQFTMFGHSSPVTIVYMDKQAPAGAVSGSTDGTVWLWDLLSGKALHKMKKHTAAIVAAQCSIHYIVSSAEDHIMCIWARRTGNLLHVNRLNSGSSHALSLLGQNWCVTGGRGCLYLWDIRSGELIQRFSLVYRSLVQPSVEHISISSDLCVVCSLDRELLVVRFPAVLEKG